MIPAFAKYFMIRKSFSLALQKFGKAKDRWKSSEMLAGPSTSRLFFNLVSRRAPDQNLRTRAIRDGLFSRLFANPSVKIVDNWGFFDPHFLETQSQRESKHNISILLIFLLTQK